MSLPVTITKAPFPAGYCWPGPDQYGNDLVALLTALVAGNISAFVTGSTTPAPGDQNKPWFRFNPDGTPDAWYIFVGSWISKHPVPPSSQSRIIWTDTEAALWSYDGGDGTNPGITPPTDTTGAMWQRDTNFGADDGSIPFSFPVGIGKNSVGYDSNPANSIGVGSRVVQPIAVAGEERHVNTVNETATHNHAINARNDVAGGGNIVVASLVSNTPDLNDKNTGSNFSHNNMPPFLGVIFAKRTVRRFYVAT